MDQQPVSTGTPQYSLAKILLIWAAAAVPMGLSLWVVMPWLIPRLDIEPGFMFLVLVTLGLVWHGVLSYIILRAEVKPFTWTNVRDRLWLHTPSDPRTGVRSSRMYWWLIPIILIWQAYGFLGPLQWLNELWAQALPFLAPPPYALIQNLAEPAVGQWWLLGVLVVLIAFNQVLGEELIFRGILLPKMNGVFGKWDWLANGILFSAYHWHKIWDLPAMLLVNWIFPWVTKRFKSYWMGAILHVSDAPFLIVIFTLAILGMIA